MNSDSVYHSSDGWSVSCDDCNNPISSVKRGGISATRPSKCLFCNKSFESIKVYGPLGIRPNDKYQTYQKYQNTRESTINNQESYQTYPRINKNQQESIIIIIIILHNNKWLKKTTLYLQFLYLS
jgi:hypothetical protein